MVEHVVGRIEQLTGSQTTAAVAVPGVPGVKLVSLIECVWTFDDGQYIGSCAPDKYINISPAGMTFCPYCGRRLAKDRKGEP